MMKGGTLPDRLLLERSNHSNIFIYPISGGMDPLIWFPQRFNEVNSVRQPKDEGMEPVR